MRRMGVDDMVGVGGWGVLVVFDEVRGEKGLSEKCWVLGDEKGNSRAVVGRGKGVFSWTLVDGTKKSISPAR